MAGEFLDQLWDSVSPEGLSSMELVKTIRGTFGFRGTQFRNHQCKRKPWHLTVDRRIRRTSTYSMVQNIIWKTDYHSAYQKISCFLYGTRRFITVFTKARHWTLSWASRIQFVPSIHISIRSNLMLSSHIRLVFPVVSYLQASEPKPCKHFSPPPCMPHVPSTSSSLI
jgi:hypothetical protein